MSENFDVHSPRGVTTRDGRKVTIYCTDAPWSFPIHGRVIDEGIPYAWQKNGRLLSDKKGNGLDLINPPAPVERIDRKVWVNVYSDGIDYHPTKEIAKHFASNSGPSRTAVPCRLVEIVEGEE